MTTMAPSAPAVADRPPVGVLTDPGAFGQAVAKEWALTDYKWHYTDVVKRSVMELGDGGGADLRGYISKIAPPSDGKCQNRTEHPIPCFSGAWRTFATVNSGWVAKTVKVQPGTGTRSAVAVEGVRTVCTNTSAGPGATRGASPAFQDLAAVIGQDKRGCFDEPISMTIAVQCEKAPVGCWINDLTSWKVGAMVPGSARLDGAGVLAPAFAQTEVPAWEQ
ncbi:hypothetical protein ACFRJ9_21745 [Paenarthrobacter sp. NPDC056912]|uniref:hypothetical protein n=1 Tax=Paenarthrobacter sp. NPDC056912 TaxID=3345965 RepID=UPI00367353B8